MERELGRRAVLGAVLAAGLAGGLVGCGEQSESTRHADPRPLTAEEAQLLAVVRFRLHQRETVPVSMVWPGSPAVDIAAVLDLHRSLGYGTMDTGSGASPGSGEERYEERYVAWTTSRMATASVGQALPRRDAWLTRSLTTRTPQDIFLLLALSLGADRPENPVLLQQSSAAFLRRDTVDDVAVIVVEGPKPASATTDGAARSRYWISDDGRLCRFEAYLGDRDGQFATLTVLDSVDLPKGLGRVARGVLRSS